MNQDAVNILEYNFGGHTYLFLLVVYLGVEWKGPSLEYV